MTTIAPKDLAQKLIEADVIFADIELIRLFADIETELDTSYMRDEMERARQLVTDVRIALESKDATDSLAALQKAVEEEKADWAGYSPAEAEPALTMCDWFLKLIAKATAEKQAEPILKALEAGPNVSLDIEVVKETRQEHKPGKAAKVYSLTAKGKKLMEEMGAGETIETAMVEDERKRRFENLVKELNNFQIYKAPFREKEIHDNLLLYMTEKGFKLEDELKSSGNRYDIVVHDGQHSRICIELKKVATCSCLEQLDRYSRDFDGGIILMCYRATPGLRMVFEKAKDSAKIPIALIEIRKNLGMV